MSDSTHKREIFILAGAVFATMPGNGLVIACWLLLVGAPPKLEVEPLRPVNTDPVEAA